MNSELAKTIASSWRVAVRSKLAGLATQLLSLLVVQDSLTAASVTELCNERPDLVAGASVRVLPTRGSATKSFRRANITKANDDGTCDIQYVREGDRNVRFITLTEEKQAFDVAFAAAKSGGAAVGRVRVVLEEEEHGVEQRRHRVTGAAHCSAYAIEEAKLHARALYPGAVSYTHLTLPTICSV